jgi:phosphate transport system permease protein
VSLLNAKISPARKRIDKVFGAFCFLSILIASSILLFLLWTVVKDGAHRLNSDFFNNFTSRLPGKAGIKAALAGTLWVIALTAVIAVPVGLAAAIYLEEFTNRRNWLVNVIQINIANLAGVPSIVYGLLGLTLFVRAMALDRSILAGALTMSILILPMIIIVAQEALRAVPKSFREASYALGATRWQTIRGQVLPSALPGILTGIILSLSRAIGETAPLITIGAVTYIATTPSGLRDKFTVLPIQVFDWSSRPQSGFHDAAAAGILVLLVVLLTMNSLAVVLRIRAQKKR